MPHLLITSITMAHSSSPEAPGWQARALNAASRLERPTHCALAPAGGSKKSAPRRSLHAAFPSHKRVHANAVQCSGFPRCRMSSTAKLLHQLLVFCSALQPAQGTSQTAKKTGHHKNPKP